MQQEESQQIFRNFEKLKLPEEDSICLDVQCSHQGYLAQIYKNNKVIISNPNNSQNFTYQSDKLLYSSAFSHPQSLNSHSLYLFGQQIQILDMEKLMISNSINTEFTYCGDSNIWNELCTANEKTLLFWDMRQKLAFNCILAHSMCITSCQYNQTGRLITTTGMDNCARVFDSYGTDCLATICGSKKTHTTSSQFTKDSKHVLVTTLEQNLGLWDWIDSNQLAQYPIKYQNRFFIKPIIIYDEQDIPSQILYPNDDNTIYQYNFLKPDNEPIIQQLNFPINQNPARLVYNEKCKKFYIFIKNDIYSCEYLF